MKIWGILCFSVLFLGYSAWGVDAVKLNDQKKLDLYSHAEIVKVGEQQYSIHEFLANQETLSFRPVENNNENIGFTSDNFWVRFSLENISNETQVYFLETARPITDEVNLFLVNDQGGIITKRSGDQVAFSERDFDHRNSIFKIKLPAGVKYQCYLHLKSDGEVINLPLILRAPTAMIASTYRTELFHGLFYGLLALAAIIYLFFYFGIRERSFLYYGFYVLSIGLLQLSLDGYVYEYILPQGGFLNSRMVMIAALLSMFFLGRYSESFLRVKESFKHLHLVYKAIYGFAALLLAGLMISPAILELSYPLGNVAGLILLFLIIGTVVAKHIKKQPVDIFFSLGIGFLVLGLVIFILNNLSLVPNNIITLNSSKLGSGLEVIFLSLSMTNLIRRLRDEKELSQTLALRKSEEMNEIKSYFMSNMSHELRTPLNAIMGLAEQMKRGNQSEEELKSNMEVIQYSSLSLLSSVNDIFDFSKIEKGELRLQYEKFNPAETLESISENWKVQAQEKNIDYELVLDENLPLVCLGDAERLTQIANNILGNAIKFTNQGSIKVDVYTKNNTEENTDLFLKVQDTGVGIPPEKMDTVFEAFLQENISNKRNFGGLGLGLSIVKKLVDLHGGKITLNSKPGVGTECLIRIPYKVIEIKKAKPTINLDDKDLKGAKLLIVEDNALNQMVLKKMLSSWKNTSFEVADNGQEALDKMALEHYDLILMDLQMPVMDGYEATQRIRQGQISDSKEVPIIAVTADTTESTREKVFTLGINDYLTKPVKTDKLYEKVASLIFEDKVHSAA